MHRYTLVTHGPSSKAMSANTETTPEGRFPSKVNSKKPLKAMLFQENASNKKPAIVRKAPETSKIRNLAAFAALSAVWH
jgi:hypothetical protein